MTLRRSKPKTKEIRRSQHQKSVLKEKNNKEIVVGTPFLTRLRLRVFSAN